MLTDMANFYQDYNQSRPQSSYGRGRSYGGGGSRCFNRGSPDPKAVEVGKENEVDIMEISKEEGGIARVQGFVVFVENAKAGNKLG